MGLWFFSIYARHFLRLFLVRFAWVFLILEVFLGLCAILVYLWNYPYLPPLHIIRAFPDLMLLLLPLSLSFSSLIAGILFVSEVRRHQGFLRIRLAGRNPTGFQLPVLVFGAAVSLALLWLNTAVLPVVHFNLRHPDIESEEVRFTIPTLMARQEKMFSRMQVWFEKLEGEELRRFAMCSTRKNASFVVTADRARFRLTGAPPLLEVELRGGRLLEVKRSGRPEDTLKENMLFDLFRGKVDTKGLLYRLKTDILHLRFYTNRELDRLPEQGRILRSRGLSLSPAQKKNLEAIPFIKAARLQLALAPFLFLVVVVFLGGQHLSRPRLRTALLSMGCLCVFLPQAFFFVQRPIRRDSFSTAWSALLPLAELFLYLLIMSISARLLRRRD